MLDPKKLDSIIELWNNGNKEQSKADIKKSAYCLGDIAVLIEKELPEIAKSFASFPITCWKKFTIRFLNANPDKETIDLTVSNIKALSSLDAETKAIICLETNESFKYFATAAQLKCDLIGTIDQEL